MGECSGAANAEIHSLELPSEGPYGPLKTTPCTTLRHAPDRSPCVPTSPARGVNGQIISSKMFLLCHRV